MNYCIFWGKSLHLESQFPHLQNKVGMSGLFPSSSNNSIPGLGSPRSREKS